ncbi:MAG: adenylate cyclase [Ancrocorticia sp.]|jgi:CYTH domain-containing protein|nr:adenylate cyclase [Ancrocorticia sp.]MCI1895958.1 adenylate cyclase [Ancrocorticia sp.]MCI1933201.1 adenylate cyclase [Ancrocorticia sp.]MCI1964319.1 adenylate cyclase [Ancrocorticia sp.]MCI2002953.1 adenylate cyclase [Ancrocorticia sp.]
MSEYADGIPHGDEALHFEFERKFFVEVLPEDVVRHGSCQVIVQAYLFAVDGYAVRVRITFPDRVAGMRPFDDAVDFLGAYERRELGDLLAAARDDGGEVHATIAVKSPGGMGERYEMETELDTDVAVQIVRRSPHVILKTRYSMWYDEDGWEFDVFGGQNEGLIIAECERLAPVVGLKIPAFCLTEVTEDLRFSNDYLSKEPWRQWNNTYRTELAARGPHFMDME